MKMLHCPHDGRAAILPPMVTWMHSCTQSTLAVRLRACGHMVKRCAEWRCLA